MQNQFITEILQIAFFLVLSIILSLLLLFIVSLTDFTSKIDMEKSSCYECGFQPFGETTYPFDVQFALVAILFLLFDVEVLFLFPLCTSIVSLTPYNIFFLIIFFIVIIIGLFYEISRNIVSFFKNTSLKPSEEKRTSNKKTP
jgi:NADH:ubiquinone oxidoreductase subunit 3 (subunit A)